VGRQRLGYGVATTVASLQHWASRLKMVASLGKCPLGERSLQFFRFRGSGCVGLRDLYPFAILFRELPAERHEELIRRAMRWQGPSTSINVGGGLGWGELGIRAVPGIPFSYRLNSRAYPKSVQVMIRAQYGIRNEEPAKTNGGHL
jgi:hypothetical protein